MTDAGYVFGGWTVSGLVLAGYVAHLLRRRRALQVEVRPNQEEKRPWQ